MRAARVKTDANVSADQRACARAMRRQPTEAELSLRRLLRDRRLAGLKFRRQVPVGPYIVDFLCVGARLIVEADGSQNAGSLRYERRDADHRGWTVPRFWNHDILRNRESVIDTILARAGLPW